MSHPTTCCASNVTPACLLYIKLHTHKPVVYRTLRAFTCLRLASRPLSRFTFDATPAIAPVVRPTPRSLTNHSSSIAPLTCCTSNTRLTHLLYGLLYMYMSTHLLYGLLYMSTHLLYGLLHMSTHLLYGLLYMSGDFCRLKEPRPAAMLT